MLQGLARHLSGAAAAAARAHASAADAAADAAGMLPVLELLNALFDARCALLPSPHYVSPWAAAQISSAGVPGQPRLAALK